MAVGYSKEGVRVYLTGDTFPVKDTIKNAGGHWDADRKQWWIGAAKYPKLKMKLDKVLPPAGEESDEKPQHQPQQRTNDTKGLETLVMGRVEYKSKTYFLLAESRDGTRMRLCFRDGSEAFWADSSAVRVLARYQERRTIKSIQDYADKKKRQEDRAEKGFGRCKSCHGPIVNAPHHRAMGGYCGHCAFDEFDM